MMIKTIATKIKDMKDILPTSTMNKVKSSSKQPKKNSIVFLRRSSSDITPASCSVQRKSTCQCAVNMQKKEANTKYDETDETYILTSLFFAIQYKQLDMLKELCERIRMDLNILNEDGISALHFAAIVGSPECIEILKEYGACSNMCDVRGQTPIYYAEMMGNTDTVKCLQALSS